MRVLQSLLIVILVVLVAALVALVAALVALVLTVPIASAGAQGGKKVLVKIVHSLTDGHAKEIVQVKVDRASNWGAAKLLFVDTRSPTSSTTFSLPWREKCPILVHLTAKAYREDGGLDNVSVDGEWVIIPRGDAVYDLAIVSDDEGYPAIQLARIRPRPVPSPPPSADFPGPRFVPNDPFLAPDTNPLDNPYDLSDVAAEVGEPYTPPGTYNPPPTGTYDPGSHNCAACGAIRCTAIGNMDPEAGRRCSIERDLCYARCR